MFDAGLIVLILKYMMDHVLTPHLSFFSEAFLMRGHYILLPFVINSEIYANNAGPDQTPTGSTQFPVPSTSFGCIKCRIGMTQEKLLRKTY